MLFPVNRETQKLIAVIRDLLFLIAVNCAQDPPVTAPLKDRWMKYYGVTVQMKPLHYLLLEAHQPILA